MSTLKRAPIYRHLLLGNFVFLSCIVSSVTLFFGSLALLIYHFSIVAIKLLVFAGLISSKFLKSFFKKVSAMPRRGLVPREGAPKLYELIESIAKKTNGPNIKYVYVDGSDNAYVTEIPRLGGLLGYRRELCIGYGMLITLSTKELEAVLAHELGHMSSKHGRFAAWVYRSVTRWELLAHSLDGQHRLTMSVVDKFLKWYVPKLDRLAMPVNRQFELEADAISAELVGSECAANTLYTVDMQAELIKQTFLSAKNLRKQALLSPQVNYCPYDAIETQLHDAMLSADREKLHETVMTRETDPKDTHPALAERVTALNIANPELNLNRKTNAATELLTPKLKESIRTVCLSVWQEQIKPLWDDINEMKQDAERLSAELVLENDQKRQLAIASFLLDDLEKSFQLFIDLTKNNSHQPQDDFYLGCIFIKRGDASGYELLKKVSQLSIHLYNQTIAFLIEENTSKEMMDEFEQIQKQLLANNAAFVAERKTATPQDEYQPVEDEYLKTEFAKVLTHFPRIKKVFFVEKKLKHFSLDDKLYVVVVDGGWFFRATRFTRSVKQVLPVNVMVFSTKFKVSRELMNVLEK